MDQVQQLVFPYLGLKAKKLLGNYLLVNKAWYQEVVVAQWHYYDFDNNWRQWREVWFSDEVQTRLAPVMEEWTQTYKMNEPDAVWKKGVYLWPFSHADCWVHWDLMAERARKRLYAHVEQSLQRTGCSKSKEMIQEWCEMTDDVQDDVEEYVKDVRLHYKPIAGSLEAQVLGFGDDELAEIQGHCAKLLFPTDQVEVWRAGYSAISVIPKRRLILDMIKFFYNTPAVQKTCCLDDTGGPNDAASTIQDLLQSPQLRKEVL